MESASAPESIGDQMGLRRTPDPLKLSANAALVIDQNTNEVLLSKNEKAVMPIASLTKLMTGLLVTDAKLPMDEEITITQDDVDTYKGTGSRLTVGTHLTRGELMHLALMSSENRAAHALGRTYPGGIDRFVQLMNQRAAELGMHDTRYVEPTGLSSDNRSSAHDLALLVQTAYQRPLLRELTTSPSYTVEAGRRQLQFHNSNRLVSNPSWDINLQKTGFINEAGRCLVMSVKLPAVKSSWCSWTPLARLHASPMHNACAVGSKAWCSPRATRPTDAATAEPKRPFQTKRPDRAMCRSGLFFCLGCGHFGLAQGAARGREQQRREAASGADLVSLVRQRACRGSPVRG